MTDAYAVINSAAPTSGPTHDVTISGLGWTPTFAYVTCQAGSADGTVVVTNAPYSVGWCDATNERCASIMVEDAGSSWDAYREMHTDKVVYMNSGTGSDNGSLSFNSFISDGIRFDVDTAFPSGYQMVVHLFRADNTLVGNANVGSSGGTAVLTHNHGTTADTFLICATTGGGVGNGTASGGHLSVGYAVGTATGATGDQCAFGCFHNDGSSTAYVWIDDDRVVLVGSGSGTSRAAEVTDWSTNSLTLTQRNHGNNFGFDLLYAAVAMPNGVDFGITAVSSGTGTQAVTTAFEPEGVMIRQSLLAGSDTSTVGDVTANTSVADGGADSDSRAHSTAAAGDDSGSGDASCLYQSDLIAALDADDDGKELVYGIDSFNASDFTIDKTVNGTGANAYCFWLAFEAVAGGPATAIQDIIMRGIVPFAR